MCINDDAIHFVIYLDILSRDCVSSTIDPEDRHLKALHVDGLEGGAIIYSHDFETKTQSSNLSTISKAQNLYTQYPTPFSCEIVIHSPIENGRIMLTINSLFIPSADQACKDDFLYVFDSNTARYKAMVGVVIAMLMAFNYYFLYFSTSSPDFLLNYLACIIFCWKLSPMFIFWLAGP